MKKKAYDEVMTDLCMKEKKYIEEKDWDSYGTDSKIYGTVSQQRGTS